VADDTPNGSLTSLDVQERQKKRVCVMYSDRQKWQMILQMEALLV